MTMEANGQSYYSMDYYDNPEWWDRWLPEEPEEKGESLFQAG
jgi:hypothetical protein